MEEIKSDFVYEEIMSAISKIQGDRSAIVILQDEDGGTTYLRHNISQEEVAKLLTTPAKAE